MIWPILRQVNILRTKTVVLGEAKLAAHDIFAILRKKMTV